MLDLLRDFVNELTIAVVFAACQPLRPFVRRQVIAAYRQTACFAITRWHGFRALTLWRQAVQISFAAYIIVGVSAGISLGHLPLA